MKQANRMVGASAISAVMLIGLSAPPAQAGYVVTLEQVGGDVVATGSGAIDLTGLSLDINFSGLASMIPSIGQILTGPALPDSSNIDVYTGITPITGPANFGSGPGAFSARLWCQGVTSRAVPCRTPRATTPGPSAASA